MTLGQAWGWGSSATEAEQMLDYFVDQGGNFVDTANLYSAGESETILGDAIAQRGLRDTLVLGTKFSMSPVKDCPNAVGNHRKSMVQSLEASLTRLKIAFSLKK
jgi:aryl-alcohol dehydrogenase-like predicted oxidoreductase